MIGQIIALAIFVVMFGTTISEKIGRCIKLAMLQWKCTFYVNGRRTEQIVSAVSSYEAKKNIEAQYSGSKILGGTLLK